MKVLYDYQIFTSQKYGGISRYFYELVRNFEDDDSILYKISLLLSNNYYISDKQYVKYLDFLPNKKFRGKNRLMSLLNKMSTIYQLKKGSYDIFHPTYYDPYFLNYIGTKPFVLTVHDMIHEKLSEFFSSKDKTTERKRLLVERASKIITVSRSTKNDLIELFDTKPSKIEVVYHGNSMVQSKKVKLPANIPKSYILFVGSRSGYKNFYRFINAISLLLNEKLDLTVVCAGGGKFNNEEILLLKKFNIQSRVFQFSLDDNLLAQLYSKALVFVFPSLYEGFGIPVLESFACSCPVVCSYTSSLPEIAEKGAEYFDPYDITSIYKSTKEVIYNKRLRKDLVLNGTERLKYFSWKKTAIKTKSIYGAVASE